MVMLAASPTRAAEAPPTGASPGIRVDPRTGRLVRGPVSSAKRPMVRTPPKPEISHLVEDAARAQHVDPLLVDSIIQVESAYNPYAVSRKGAEGLMQLTPPTARSLGVSNSFDPRQNIEAGVKYLKYLQDLYKDDRLALAAYNAGPGAVDRYGWVPPFAETQYYVHAVGQRYQDAKDAAAAQRPVAGASTSAVEQEKHPKLEQFVDQDGRLHLKMAP